MAMAMAILNMKLMEMMKAVVILPKTLQPLRTILVAMTKMVVILPNTTGPLRRILTVTRMALLTVW